MTIKEVEALRQAIRCLAIEIPEAVHRDIDERVEAVLGLLEIPAANRIPENLDGPRCEIDGYHVGSWCPQRDGRGPATQVHLTFDLGIDGVPPMAIRLKTPRACDQLIAALQRHRFDVWPTP